MSACSAAESSADSPMPSRGSSRYSPDGERQPGVTKNATVPIPSANPRPPGPSQAAPSATLVAMPTTWTCNACGSEGPTSREHLIHVAIGRVILADRGLSSDEVRRRLQEEEYREFRRYAIGQGFPLGEKDVGQAWFNTEIRGLICRSCNSGWAKDLEEAAGPRLYSFVHLHGQADEQVLRRWAAFFAIKLWWAYRRTEVLADGALRSILPKLADPKVQVEPSVCVARLHGASPQRWNFAGTMGGWAAGLDGPYIPWIIRGVVWIFVLAKRHTTGGPIPSTELVNGVTLADIERVGPADLVALLDAPQWHTPDAT